MTTKGRAAIDTNVILHVHDTQDFAKQVVASELLAQQPYISSQVVSEYFNVLQRRFHKPKREALEMGRLVLADCPFWSTTHDTLTLAAHLLARYDFQLFDAIVVAAALEAGCDLLYSADFQHQQLIEGRLRLVNPFV